MIVVCGDLHVRREEPFFSSFVKFQEWFTALPLNSPENTLILTGDVFHNPIPKSQDFKTVAKLVFKDLKFKKIYVLQGSHDYNRRYGSSLAPLSIFDNVEIMDYPKQVEIENLTYLFLPFYYKGTNNLPSMKEYYEHLPEEMQHNDFIIGHFFEEHEQGFGEWCDLSYITGTRIFGHRHIPMQNYYIGTPNITRYDERGKTGYINLIDTTVSEIEVPKFLDYYDLDFEKDNVANQKVDFPIFDVWNCPSKETAIQKYGPIYIREIHKKVEKAGDYDKVERKGKRTIRQYMVDYLTKEKVSKPVENILLGMIDR